MNGPTDAWDRELDTGPPALLPGKTANDCSMRVLHSLAGAAGGVLAIPASSYLITAQGVKTSVIVIFVFIVIAFSVALMAASLALGRTNRNEAAAGYTTLFNPKPQQWQLNPKTGEVVRRPQSS